jgi:DNA-binding response OmpR family regulator
MHQKTPSVWVIEDDEFMASLLRFILERQQMQVTRVADGRSALKLIDEGHACDVVLLDLMLPQTSGMEVLAHMQKTPLWATKPVLVLSALDDDASMARALAAGSRDYLTKPFDPEELLARLMQCLDTHAGEQRAFSV